MTLSLHLRIVGVLLMALGASHAFFSRHFGWEEELAAVSSLTRRIFFVHNFFIGLGVFLGGAVTLLCAGTLVQPGVLGRGLLAAMTLFWLCRLAAQFLAYEPELWRGDRFRTLIHVTFSVLWCYVTGVYAIALMAGWKGNL